MTSCTRTRTICVFWILGYSIHDLAIEVLLEMLPITDPEAANRVRTRYLVSASGLVASQTMLTALKGALHELEAGDAQAGKDALESVLEMAGIERGEFSGNLHSIHAEWFKALGPHNQTRAFKFLSEALDLHSWLSLDVKAGRPADKSRALKYEKLIAEATWLQKVMPKSDEGAEIEFEHGPFHVIPMPGVSKKMIAEVLDALDEAADKIRPKFSAVLYGNVYISTVLGKKIGEYVGRTDALYVSAKAKKGRGTVYVLVHELGHRYDFRFWHDAASRKRFNYLSDHREYVTVKFDAAKRQEVAEDILKAFQAKKQGRSIPTLGPDTMLWIKSGGPDVDVREISTSYLRGELTDEQVVKTLSGTEDMAVQTDTLLHGPLSVTPYGATNVLENFAEAFAHYVLGMPFPEPLKEILEALS